VCFHPTVVSSLSSSTLLHPPLVSTLTCLLQFTLSHFVSCCSVTGSCSLSQLQDSTHTRAHTHTQQHTHTHTLIPTEIHTEIHTHTHSSPGTEKDRKSLSALTVCLT